MNLSAIAFRPVRSALATDLLALFLRVALAAPFWMSGRTKVEEGTLISISETTFFLFENEYSGVPIPPEIAAVMATAAEHALPILLLAGLFTRAAALGLVIMTAVIQVFVYPDAWWTLHMQWTALGLAVILLGPGRWSLDRLLFDRSRE
jgi:putative oxidoreductase